MVDHADTIGTRNTSPTPREQEAKRKHVERIHFREDSVRGTDQQKREREERYARSTRQITIKKSRNASESPEVGSHTTEATHHRSQSEGGSNNKAYKGHDTTVEDKLIQSEDEDDLILGTPLGTYILRTKGTKNNTGTHTPVGKTWDKGITPQGIIVDEEFSRQRNWEDLKRNFEEQFSYEDSGFSGGSTQNNTDQKVKRPITQEEFDELKRKSEEKLK